MPTPIEHALSTLLPTLSYLPPDLISLANSLLAQSRAKAASLKAEEEIARIYVCAHIACERSKKRLDLEVGRALPPCKPRVYERLYGYLEGVLRDGGRTPVKEKERGKVETPRSAKRGRDYEGVKTPGSTKRVREEERAKTPSSSKRARPDEEEENGVPDFVMPMIRAICKSTNVLAAAPHVHVGAQAVAREIKSRTQKREDPPSRKRRRTNTPQAAKAEAGGLAIARWPALVLALFCLTAAKIREEEEDDAELKKLGIEAVKTFCAEKADTLPEGVDAKLRSLDADVRFYLLEAEESGWLEMEWYQNIPVEQNDEDEDEIMEDAEDEEEDAVTPKQRKKVFHKTPLQRKEKRGEKFVEGDLGPAGLRAGNGTMFSAAVDWLSEERRAEFAVWKKGILKEIAVVEQRA